MDFPVLTFAEHISGSPLCTTDHDHTQQLSSLFLHVPVCACVGEYMTYTECVTSSVTEVYTLDLFSPLTVMTWKFDTT